jgi:hypothetical protein
MQKIEVYVLKDIICHIEAFLTNFDRASVYKTFVWQCQLSGESNLFRGVVRACNSID